jgi:hypothetical protein
MKLDIRSDIRQVELSLTRLPGQLREQAIARALNRAAVSVRAEAARQIADELGRPFTPTKVKERIAIRRASGANLVAVVVVGGAKNLPLAVFGARGTRRGVRVRYRGQTITLPHAWMRPLRGNGRLAVTVRASEFKGQIYPNVALRQGKGSRTAPGNRPDYPIAEILVPGIPTVFQAQRIRAAYERVARDRFRATLEQETRFRLQSGRL